MKVFVSVGIVSDNFEFSNLLNCKVQTSGFNPSDLSRVLKKLILLR
jgi:hypothetical protein